MLIGGLCLLGSVATGASAQTICAGPERDAAPAQPSAAPSKPPVAPLSRALWDADNLRRAGRVTEADAGYTKLLRAGVDRRQTARRAALRLAQSAIAREDYASARSYLDQAARSGALPEVREDVERLRLTVSYREGIAAARTRFASVDGARDAGAEPAVLIPQYRALLGQSCPYPDDFPARLHWRLASELEESADYDGAEAELAAAEGALPPAYAATDKGVELKGQLAQARTDLTAGKELARAATLQESDPAGARQAITGVLAASPAPSPRVIERARYRLASNLASTGDFAGAREQLALIRASLDAADPQATTRLSEAETQLAQREIDAAAREKLAAADAIRADHPYQAIDSYRAVIDQTPPVSPAISDGARIDLADTLRRERFYAAGREELAKVSTPPATPVIGERAAAIGQRFDLDTPANSLTGEIGAGLFYDSNAPALVNALRTEVDDVGYPNEQKFDDGVAMLRGQLAYRGKMSDNYDYWLATGTVTRTEQFDLHRLDRTLVELATGPVFNLPEQRMTVSVAATYDYERRGGDFLQENYGVFAAVQKRFDPGLELEVTYAFTKRNDTRRDLDGHNHDIQVWLQTNLGNGHDLRPRLRIQRRNVERATFDTWRTAGELRYRYIWGDPSTQQYGISIAPEYERFSYRRGLSPAAKRKDDRFDVTGEFFVRFRRQFEVGVEYRYLDTDSNFLSGERLPNHRVGLTTRWLF